MLVRSRFFDPLSYSFFTIPQAGIIVTPAAVCWWDYIVAGHISSKTPLLLKSLSKVILPFVWIIGQLSNGQFFYLIKNVFTIPQADIIITPAAVCWWHYIVAGLPESITKSIKLYTFPAKPHYCSSHRQKLSSHLLGLEDRNRPPAPRLIVEW